MSKRILFVLGLSALLAEAFSAPVSVEAAKQKAVAFLAKHRPALGARQAGSMKMELAGLTSGCYLLNVGEADGWVIAGRDDTTAPILGYADSGRLNPDRLPCNMKAWLQTIDEQTAQARYDGKTYSESDTEPPLQPIAPLLTSQWGQRSPYNLLTPLVIDRENGTEVHAVTGCGPTAMAQVMRYHQWPKDSIAIENDNARWAMPPTQFDWSLMRDRYEVDDTTSSAKEVAKLMRYAGAAACAFWDAQETGAYGTVIRSALIGSMGYSREMKLIDCYDDDAQFDMTVYQELANGRPVLLTAGGNNSSHAFVCDGYSSDRFFHMNWGWSGECDGYYLMTALNPTHRDETWLFGPAAGFIINAYINLHPQGVNEQEEPKRLIVDSMWFSEEGIWMRDTPQDDFKDVMFNSIQYCLDKNMEVGVGLYQGGRLLSVLQHRAVVPERVGYDGWLKQEWCFSFGSNLPKGEYQIKAICKNVDSDEWLDDMESDEVYLVAIVQDQKLQLYTHYDYATAVAAPHAVATGGNDGQRLFDLQGRRLPLRPRTGLYVENGKKYIR